MRHSLLLPLLLLALSLSLLGGVSSLMVVDPAGRLVGALPPPLQPERMVQQFYLLRDHLEPTHPARRALARLF